MNTTGSPAGFAETAGTSTTAAASIVRSHVCALFGWVTQLITTPQTAATMMTEVHDQKLPTIVNGESGPAARASVEMRRLWKRTPPMSEFKLLIDGKLVEADSGKTFDNINPATEEVLGSVTDASSAEMLRAIDAARRAFCRTRADESVWPWIDPGQVLDADQRSRQRRGIPRQALARLITRLEQL